MLTLRAKERGVLCQEYIKIIKAFEHNKYIDNFGFKNASTSENINLCSAGAENRVVILRQKQEETLKKWIPKKQKNASFYSELLGTLEFHSLAGSLVGSRI